MKTKKILSSLITIVVLSSAYSCNNYDIDSEVNALINADANIMFITDYVATSMPFTANINGINCTTGSGVAKANCICDAEAKTIVKTNIQFFAWLSNTANNAGAFCNLLGLASYDCSGSAGTSIALYSRGTASNIKTVKVANSMSDFLKGNLLNAPYSTGRISVMTGTTQTGIPSAADCGSWSSPGGGMTVGSPRSSNSSWTNSSSPGNCAAVSSHLYCFSRPR